MSVTEFLERFPHESAIVLQHSVQTSAILGTLLASHCVKLLLEFHSVLAAVSGEALLLGLLAARLLCILPRPYFWHQALRRIARARCEPTPQLIAEHLVAIRAPNSPLAKASQHLFYAWLVCTFAAACAVELQEYECTGLPASVRRHCFLTGLAMLAQKVVCIVSFILATRKPGLHRGLASEALEGCSQRLVFEPESAECLAQLGQDPGDMECSICLGAYSPGEELRKLKCGHHFHQCCLDSWLLEHQNKCPLCLSIVGPSE
jgi:hypothetical protein